MLDKSLLEPHRQEAEHFYETDPEYRASVEELNAIIQKIHGRVIALEGLCFLEI